MRPKLSGRIRQAESEIASSPRLGKAGTIRIGEKREKNGKEFPTSLDYFKCDARHDYVQRFQQAYGEKPDKLEITFISDDPSYSCYDRYELRDDKGKLYGIADGLEDDATIYLYMNKQWKEISLQRRQESGGTKGFMDGAAKHCNSPSGWRRRLTLRFMLLRIPDLAGIFELHTGGKASSIQNIIGTFDLIQQKAGTVIFVPFDLCVDMAKSDTSGDNKRYPVLSLIPNRGAEALDKLRQMVEAGQEPWRLGLSEPEIIEPENE